MNFPSNFPELMPPSKEKEIPAALTDPQIRASRQPDPQAILAMAKISTQTNYQSKIGNPLAVSGPFGLGSLNPMLSPNAGREVLNTQSPLTSEEIGKYQGIALKQGAIELLKRGGLLARGTNPAGIALTTITPLTLNAGEEDFLANKRYSFSEEEIRKEQLLYQAEQAKQNEIFQKQKREREERWSNMKADELNIKLHASDDHISRYFSRRAIK